MTGSLFTGDDVDQEIEHVAFRKGRCDVGSLKSAAFVLLRVDPRPHGQLGDEDVAAFGEEDGSFGTNHLDFWIGFHDLLYARERELVDLVVVRFRFQGGDGLLPVGG